MTAQCQVLNKVLDTKDFSLLSLNGISEDFFADYKLEYRFIRRHYDAYGVVPDTVTFLNTFPDFEVLKVAEPNSFLLAQLYEDYQSRYMATTFNEIKKLLESGKTDEARQVLSTAASGIQTSSAITCTNLITDRARLEHYKEKLAPGGNNYIKTGFKELDDILGGMDPLNENVVIAARTGVGKTQILLKMATEAAKQGLTVGIYEGEMSADKVGYRVDTFLGHMNNMALNRGLPEAQREYEYFLSGLNLQNYGDIKVFTPNDVPGYKVTVDTIEAFMRQENIDIMFIDQYDLMDDRNHARTYTERIANIASDIKQLQVKLQKPFISVSQFNRTKTEDGSKDTSQVAGSDMIPRYATIMLALDHEFKEATDNYGHLRKTVELSMEIIKARDGGDGNKITYIADFNTGNFIYKEPAARNEEEADNQKNAYALSNDEAEDY